MNLYPKEIDDLYRAIFEKITPRYLHHTINYLKAIARSFRGPLSLEDIAFIDEGPQAALERPFADIPFDKRVERCHKTKVRIMRRTRNLVECREVESDRSHTDSVSEDAENWDLTDTISGDENTTRRVYDSSSISVLTRDGNATTHPQKAVSTKSSGEPSCVSPVNEPLLRMQVSLVHRTLREYMGKAPIWEPIVERASQTMLVDPCLSLMACALSKLKTVPSELRVPGASGFLYGHFNGIMYYAYVSVESNSPCSSFLESIFSVFMRKFPNWTEFWGLPLEWGCGFPCILAHCGRSLHLQKVFEQHRIDERYLPHLLAHTIANPSSGNETMVSGNETIEMARVLLQNGCRINDIFLGHSAWEYLVYLIPATTGYLLELGGLFLENGADPNLVIQCIEINKFPFTYRPFARGITEKGIFPCYPMHMIIAAETGLPQIFPILQLIRRFLEHGARLDVKDANGDTVLEYAAHWLLSNRMTEDQWNLAPILLRLKKECQSSSGNNTEMLPDPVPKDPILDLSVNWKYEETNRQVPQKLERLLAKLKEEGYEYVSKRENVLSDSLTPKISDE